MNAPFNPTRLELALMRRGQSKHDLAVRLRCGVSRITSYVMGRAEPHPNEVTEMAEFLDFPPAFFYGKTLELPFGGGYSSEPQAARRIWGNGWGSKGLFRA